MRASTRLSAAVAVTLLAIAPAACGGGSGRLSKHDFVEKANGICAKSNAKIKALPPPDLADPHATPNILRRILAIQREAVAKLRALQPPEKDEPAIKKWLGFVERELDQATAEVRALERGDRDGVDRANAKGARLDSSAAELAIGYGVKRCATQATESTPTSSAAQ